MVREMIQATTLLLILTFGCLSALHFYWLFGGTRGLENAIPQIEDKAAFNPPWWATAIVASGLTVCAGLIAAIGGILDLPAGPHNFSWLAYTLSGCLALRAIGDFKLVGFMKQPRNSKFARLDTAVYSPLCVVLSVAVFAVTWFR
jgi:Protein of unknown function (DUF3995)